MVVEAVINANGGRPTITENDLNVTNIVWDLANNTGTATATGAGKYSGTIPLTFTIDPNDPNRPTTQKLKKTK